MRKDEHSVNKARTLKWMCLLKSKEATRESQNRNRIKSKRSARALNVHV